MNLQVFHLFIIIMSVSNALLIAKYLNIAEQNLEMPVTDF